ILSGWKARPTFKTSFKGVPVWRQKYASFIIMKLPRKEHAKAVNTNGSFRRVRSCGCVSSEFLLEFFTMSNYVAQLHLCLEPLIAVSAKSKVAQALVPSDDWDLACDLPGRLYCLPNLTYRNFKVAKF
ncbi:MAG: hypothetical protein WCP55_09455, partial [Lentisphaerota bacterium]